MEIVVKLKDVEIDGGVGCEMTVSVNGEEPPEGTKLASIPSLAFMIAIQTLHKNGEYLTIAAEAMNPTGKNDDKTDQRSI